MAAYPENTLIGIEAALRAGACLVEFDVQMSGDGKLLVIHDANLQRTSGINLDVFSSSYADIHPINVHQPDLFGDKFIGLNAPLLKEVFELFEGFSNAKAVVEIKQESLQQWGIEDVMDTLLPVLESHQSTCLLISFSLPALQYAREKSTVAIGWVLPVYDEETVSLARELNPEVLICNQKKIPTGARPEKGSWEWMLYDIKDPEQALRWAELGVDMIETADIGTLLQDHVLKQGSCHYGL